MALLQTKSAMYFDCIKKKTPKTYSSHTICLYQDELHAKFAYISPGFFFTL